MRLVCPHCDARIRLAEPPDGTRVKCPECKARFRPPEPDDEDDDEDDDYDELRARRKKGKGGRAEAEKKFPVVPVVVGGVVAVAAIVGLVVVLVAGKSKPAAKPTETAAAPAETPEITAPQPRLGTPPAAGPAIPGGQGGPAVPPGIGGPGLNPAGPKPFVPGPRPAGPGPKAAGPGPNVGGPIGSRPVPAETIPAVYAELFQPAVDSKPPTIRAATLNPTVGKDHPEVPTFYSLMMARKDAKGTTPKATPKDAKLTLDEVKKACAYIKVDAGDLSSTGSGFLAAVVGQTGLVATNYHVIEAAAGPRYGNATAKVTAVFNAGLADERSLKAEIVAFDPVADLAILRVVSRVAWPKPLDPYNTPPKVVEGTPIQFWGFPLGDILASGNKSPEITLGTGAVSSLRHTATGKLDRVQISGTMNPGNSGGPLVDTDGRLVGVAVSIVNPKIGTGIGFAVPVNDLIALLEGKLMTTLFVPTGIENGQAKFIVFVPVMDPLDKVDTVFVRRWAGDGPPPAAVKDPFTGYKPFAMQKDGKANLPGTQEFPLKKLQVESDVASALGIALGEMTVPVDAEGVMIQVASQTGPNPQTGAKLTAASNPVGYTLTVADLPVGTDARPFAELAGRADQLAGQVIVVKGRVLAPPNTRGAVQELIVTGTDGQRADRARFLVTGAMAAQFDEVDLEQQPLPVRLVCRVGQRGPDGITPIRIARLDFIGRGNRIVRTIPAPPGPKDALATLNRDPKQFAGQTLKLDVSAVPLTPRIRESNDFHVIFPNHRPPRNVVFTISDAMKQRLVEAFGKDLRLNMIVPVRLTAIVPGDAGAGGGLVTVTVTKIEFTDDDGKVIKTVE